MSEQDAGWEQIRGIPDRREWSGRGGRGRAGLAMGSLLLVLLLLVGLGAWNYHRNWQYEQQTDGPRPYESYGIEDLRALEAAYSVELETMERRLAEAKGRRVRPAGDRGSIGENVEQFRETARISTSIRDAAADVISRQRQIAQLDLELEIRARLGEGLMRHLQRLTAI